MKKSIFFSLLATLSLGMASCSTDSNVDGQTPTQEGEMKTYTMVGGYDETNSATRMILTSTAFQWESTDVVHIWNSAGTELATAKPTNISSDGKTATFTFTTSDTPNSVTFGTSSITTDGKNLTLDATKVYSHDNTAQYKNGANPLPIMAWALIESTTNNQLAFTLKHKISYIWFKSMTQQLSGYDQSTQVSEYTKATMDPTTGKITAVDANSYTTTTLMTSNPTGYMIPFIPITNTNAKTGSQVALTPANDFIVKYSGNTIVNKILFMNTMADNMIYPLTRTYKGSATNIYWQWDAYNTWQNTTTGDWGPTTVIRNTASAPATASASCQYCPTAAEAVVILGNGWYWDATNKGGWFMKYTKCDKTKTVSFKSGTSNYCTKDVAPTAGTPSDKDKSNYFFLPAYGKWQTGTTATLSGNGDTGWYWLRDAGKDFGTLGQLLTFTSSAASLCGPYRAVTGTSWSRVYGMTLWDAQ
jgi:hypothetical protein